MLTDEDQAPVADAGGEQVIVLPAPLVTVNGNKSTDDRNIVSYMWTRDRTSPAAGVSSCSLVNDIIIIIIKAICNAQDPLKKAANALSGS